MQNTIPGHCAVGVVGFCRVAESSIWDAMSLHWNWGLSLPETVVPCNNQDEDIHLGRGYMLELQNLKRLVPEGMGKCED